MPGVAWEVSGSPNYLIGQGPVDVEDLPALVHKLESDDAAIRARGGG